MRTCGRAHAAPGLAAPRSPLCSSPQLREAHLGPVGGRAPHLCLIWGAWARPLLSRGQEEAPVVCCARSPLVPSRRQRVREEGDQLGCAARLLTSPSLGGVFTMGPGVQGPRHT